MNIVITSHGTYELQDKPHAAYVGRSGWAGRWYTHAFYALGNPFSVKMGRRACVGAYREWLWDKIESGDVDVIQALDELLEIYQEHGKLVLVCHCIDTDDLSGFDCHAQVIGRALVWYDTHKEVR